ncbi:MAG: hypothetical protein IJ113_08310 [Eggerthellaceae bacterium]|nr:hypothetical protein [Eggerthellaceae bacterium]
MTEKAPFEQLIFNLNDRVNGRVLFQMAVADDDNYDLHVEKGPATQPSVDFTRTVPRKTAEALRDAMANLGVFGWDEEYPDDEAGGSRRWTLRIVFQEGVYTQQCSGGSKVPDNFDALLEEFYQLDLPRPGADDAPGIAMPAGMPAGMPMGFPDMSALFAGAPEGGPDAALLAEMQQAMADLQAHPERFQQQLKEEFLSLPPEAQNSMLDMLASTGMGSRDWWERFLKG